MGPRACLQRATDRQPQDVLQALLQELAKICGCSPIQVHSVTGQTAHRGQRQVWSPLLLLSSEAG